MMNNQRTWVYIFKASIFWLAIIFIVKGLIVLYSGSRDVSLGYPYDTFNFDPAHRFTDFLLIWKISHLQNIYDFSDPFYAIIPPAPYSYLQFVLLRYVPFSDAHITKYLYFMVFLLAFVFFIYKIYARAYKFQDENAWFIFFIAFCFPLHFIIDRGNVDIIASTLLAVSIFSNLVDKENEPSNKLSFSCLVLMAALKPTFIIYLLPIALCYSFRFTVISFSFVSVIYLSPVFLHGAPIDYMFSSISGALKLLDKQVLYCSNLFCGLRSINIMVPSNFYLILFTVVLSVCSLIVIAFKIAKIQGCQQKLFFSMLLSTAILLIFNDPSPDYRLCFLIPFFLAAPLYVDIKSRRSANVIIFIVVALFGYVNLNIYFLSKIAFFHGFIRAVSLVVVFVYVIYILDKKLTLDAR